MLLEQSDLAWINDYVGVPYVVNGRDRAGWDCWGLVLAVYRDRLGVELPDWRRPAPYGLAAQLRGFATAWDEAQGHAIELEGPAPLAIALVMGHHAPHHVGVVAGAGVLHCAARWGGTVWEPSGRFLQACGGAQWWKWQG